MINFKVVQGYLQRSADYLGVQSTQIFKSIHDTPQSITLFSLSTIPQLKQWIVGSDADINGHSTAYWALTQSNNAIFYGTISTKLPIHNTNKIQNSGYAGIRSKELDLTLFHRPRIDTSMHRYLVIKAKGDKAQYMVNIITENPFPSIIWQHRLNFKRVGEWEEVKIPFRDFVRTCHGFVQQNQMEMNRAKVKTIGFSILGQVGDFSLEIHSITMCNSLRTLGDFDLLSADESIDSDGIIRNSNSKNNTTAK